MSEVRVDKPPGVTAIHQPPGGREGAHDPRVFLAAERTFLAWIRTGLALMGFGFVVARFGVFLRELGLAHAGEPSSSPGLSLWFGTLLVVLGVMVHLVSAIQHVRVVDRLRRGEPFPGRPSVVGLAISLLLAALGVAMAGYLIVVSR